MSDVTQIEKIPPQNLEAEMSLLGSILLDKDAILKIADIVTADDFYKRGTAQTDDTREVIAEIFKRNANDPERLIDDIFKAYSSELEVDIDHYVDYFGLSGQLNPVYSKIKNFAFSVFDRFRALFKPYG